MEWLQSMWNPCGIHMESILIPCGIHVDIPSFHVEFGHSITIPCGIQMEWRTQNEWDPTQNIFHMDGGIHMESTWNPHGQMDSTWIPDGFQMDSTWIPHGFHVECGGGVKTSKTCPIT